MRHAYSCIKLFSFIGQRAERSSDDGEVQRAHWKLEASCVVEGDEFEFSYLYKDLQTSTNIFSLLLFFILTFSF